MDVGTDRISGAQKAYLDQARNAHPRELLEIFTQVVEDPDIKRGEEQLHKH